MRTGRQSGQAMVEFALILPLLLLVVLMGLQALVLMAEHAQTQRCAGELARYGATVGGTAGQIEASIAGYAAGLDVCATETGRPLWP